LLQKVGLSVYNVIKRALTALVVVLVVVLAYSAVFAQSIVAPTGYKWNKTFDSATGAVSKTMPYGGCTHGAGELEYYTAGNVAKTSTGYTLTAQKQGYGGEPYTSGVVSTWDGFTQLYGLWECRAMMPTGKGLWPGFWLKNLTTWPPEIDVFEDYGAFGPNLIYQTLHWTDASGVHQCKSNIAKNPNATTGYHVYAVDWEPASVTWYIDGVQTSQQTTNIPKLPMFFILDLAVQSKYQPDSTTTFPAKLPVDYVRVWQKSPSH
jgi:beta-glucanase (GH16 family)